MGQRRPDRIHGILVVDKPAGISSQDLVTEVRVQLGVRSAGHTGTLDPLATGVLPICLGQATKIVQWLIADDKAYTCTARLGVTSPTLDVDGALTHQADVTAIDPGQLERALAPLRGAIAQLPPMFSAIQQGGQRLHELARAGVEVTRVARAVRVDRLEVVAVEPPHVRLAIACSKGTYVRALVRDLGAALGTGAVVAALRRTASGRFTLADAVDPRALDRPTVAARLIPIRVALGLPEVAVTEADRADVRNGRPDRLARFTAGFGEGERFQLVAPGGDTLAVCEARAGQTFIHRGLSYPPPRGLDARRVVPQSPAPNQGRESGPD
ncbi:MAG: tRNA pseudouridine(55) synthase TruB [Kofleriaceae bacterium]